MALCTWAKSNTENLTSLTNSRWQTILLKPHRNVTSYVGVQMKFAATKSDAYEALKSLTGARLRQYETGKQLILIDTIRLSLLNTNATLATNRSRNPSIHTRMQVLTVRKDPCSDPANRTWPCLSTVRYRLRWTLATSAVGKGHGLVEDGTRRAWPATVVRSVIDWARKFWPTLSMQCVCVCVCVTLC
jgi:hypothetical protein